MDTIKFELEGVISKLNLEIENGKTEDAQARNMGMVGINWKLANQLEILKSLNEALEMMDYNKETGLKWPNQK